MSGLGFFRHEFLRSISCGCIVFFVVFFLAGFFLSHPSSARAASVQAGVDSTVVRAGQGVTLNITVEGGDGKVVFPAKWDFEVVSQGTSSSVQIINGSMSSRKVYSYTLRPRKSGSLLIPALTVAVQDEAFQTRPIKISVNAPGKGSAGTGKSAAVVMESSLSEKTVFIGQDLIYTLKVFQMDGLARAQLRQPDFGSLTVQQSGEQKNYQGVYKGKSAKVTEINYLLAPAQAGNQTIGPAGLDCEVVVRQGRSRNFAFDRFFNDPFFSGSRTEKRFFSSNPVMVEVIALPAYKGPGSFTGLIGDFSMAASLDQTGMVQGESATLTIRVNGRGNIQDAARPDPVLPKGIKAYADTPVEDIQQKATGFTGSKVFKWALVGAIPGDYKFSAPGFVYFNPWQGRYLNAKSVPLNLTINPGKSSAKSEGVKGLPSLSGAGNRTRHAERVAYQNRDILPIIEDVQAGLTPSTDFGWSVFGAACLLPPSIFCLCLLIFRLKGREKSRQAVLRSQADKLFVQAVSSSDIQEKLRLSSRGLTAAVLALKGTAGENMTYDEVRLALENSGIAPELQQEVTGVLRELDSLVYGGSVSSDKAEMLVERSKSLVQSIRRGK